MGTFFFHGRIWRDDGSYASAMVVRRGRIAALGEDAALRELAEGCDFIDCGGRVMIPGFQDACLCLMAACSPILPEDCRDWSAIRGACLRWLEQHPHAARRGLYACARFQGCFPDRNALDELLSGAPLVLEDVSAGVSVLNTCALTRMEQAGISAQCAQWMRRGADGRPDGLVRGSACREAMRLVPPMPTGELRKLLETMLHTAAAQGITGLQSCDLGMTLPMETLSLLERMYQEQGGLPRLQCFRWPTPGAQLPHAPQFSQIDRQPTRGAVLVMQQSDAVHFQYDLAQLHHLIHRAGRQGMQLWVRAQGKKQLEEALEGWEALPAAQENLQRPVILGAQGADLPLLERMGAQKLGMAVQPLRLAAEAMPELLSASARLGVHIGFAGLDICRPFSGLQAAVTLPGQGALSRERALDAYTRGSAWLHFREGFLGRLASGYAADLQLLDRDYFTCPAQEIGSIRPVLVMAAGEILRREI